MRFRMGGHWKERTLAAGSKKNSTEEAELDRMEDQDVCVAGRVRREAERGEHPAGQAGGSRPGDLT